MKLLIAQLRELEHDQVAALAACNTVAAEATERADSTSRIQALEARMEERLSALEGNITDMLKSVTTSVQVQARSYAEAAQASVARAATLSAHHGQKATLTQPPAFTPEAARAQARNAIQAKKILIDPLPSPAPKGKELIPDSYSLVDMKGRLSDAMANANLSKTAGFEVTITLLERLPNKGMLLEFNTDQAASWVRSTEGRKAFLKAIPVHATIARFFVLL
ncbi:hypothetical protein K488DRAFT_81828 [Vararia minispora EC-137]|uniref:Uncharacterized protein n=1 Tax=Vararia minispora EC-137 TaxID=1314806 RepID=A0ACB8QYW9_9AGAM|nr:hypothetical protein K488DRAFT_81828 [Vararia minispora EC-137]